MFFITFKSEDKDGFQEAHTDMTVPACLDVKGKAEVFLAEGHQ